MTVSLLNTVLIDKNGYIINGLLYVACNQLSTQRTINDHCLKPGPIKSKITVFLR